jgi:SAM-dependent methyltransferase
MPGEIERIRKSYSRRISGEGTRLYNPLRPEIYLALQEKERKLIRWIKRCGQIPIAEKRVLEIGCGSGSNILQLIQLGFSPANIVANELLSTRAAMARERLPSAVSVLVGDASELDLSYEQFDIVLQSTVFSSILDISFQKKLADHIWKLTKSGGGILWYDFTYDNPQNPDVRGIPYSRIRELFPNAKITRWRLTLAPPVSRRVTRAHPVFYTLFNSMPFLRTHLLCWIQKLS